VRAHIVGSGLAALAAAAHLIRDGGLRASSILVYEAGDGLGGAMGIAGGPSIGYVLPTARIFELEYRCTFELLSRVPSASDPEKSIKDEILAFNAQYGFRDRAHVIDRDGKIIRNRHYGVSLRDRLTLVRLALTPEASLEDRRIDEYFSEDFFRTEFWMLWAPIMGSLPQHSAMEMRRYIWRFMHMLPELSSMSKILRTPYNQYEAIIEPLVTWLRRQGVNFLTGAVVRRVAFAPHERITANGLEYVRGGEATDVEIAPDDVVLVTNGSQVADLSIGSMTTPPSPCREGRSWALWHSLAQGRTDFGNPAVFFGAPRVPDTKWLTFAVTTTDATFFDLMTALTGSETGRGGLVTLKDSNWLLTLTIFRQPEFIRQPSEVMVWWGYALYPDKPGNFVGKPAAACSGAEILAEVLGQLRFERHAEAIVASSTCIPCLLPYAGSVWMPRKRTDRPPAVPPGSTNFGFIGQFAEIPLDTAFTMEYSVRSARAAVATLLRLDARPPAVYQGQYDPSALYRALKAMA